jgi:hypothetical protein
MESLDFVYETNILGAAFTDNIKYKYPKTYTSSSGVETWTAGPYEIQRYAELILMLIVSQTMNEVEEMTKR